jgi:integrase
LSLTDLKIRALKPGKERQEIPDSNGLYLLVQPSGAKSWALRYRLNGRPSKLTLGSLWLGDVADAPQPEIGGALTLKGARRIAAEVQLTIDTGTDPSATKRQASEKRREALAATFEATAVEYMKRAAGMRVDAEGNASFDTSKLRTGHERWRLLRRMIFPAIGSVPIVEIKKSDVVRLLDRIADGEQVNDEGELMQGGPIAADRALALIRKILNWFEARSDEYRAPSMKGLRRVQSSENARDRVLNDDELRVIWKVAGEIEGPFGALIKVLLLTGARRAEVALMKWDEISGTDWELPKERNKTKQPLVRPLSKAAQAVLAAQPRIMDSPWIFSLDGRYAMQGYSRHKALFDEAVRKHTNAVQPWRLHDLRRTARSLMGRAGVLSEHAERCLGHFVGNVVAQTYDRHKYHHEMSLAFEALSSLIKQIVEPEANAAVVQLVRR